MADFMDEDVISHEIHMICWLLPSTHSSISSFPVASSNHITSEEHSFAPRDYKLVDDLPICNFFKIEQENNIVLGCASFFKKEASAVKYLKYLPELSGQVQEMGNLPRSTESFTSFTKAISSSDIAPFCVPEWPWQLCSHSSNYRLPFQSRWVGNCSCNQWQIFN